MVDEWRWRPDRVVDSATNAKLKVKFFWFEPAGDYWIFDPDANCDYAVVGTPNRRYLWILAREKSMDKELYLKLVDHARKQAFPVERLEITGQIE